MGVYDVVLWPENRKVLGSKWVLHIKHGPNGAIQKYKARVVAQGFTQIEGMDYNEMFAPVAKLASLCTILALNAELEEEIYMAPPPSFNIPDGMVLKLNKAKPTTVFLSNFETVSFPSFCFMSTILPWSWGDSLYPGDPSQTRS